MDVIRAVGVVGWRASGKTRVLVGLAEELGRRGHRVITLKHAASGLDLPAKDTALHLRGAEATLAVSPELTALFLRGERPWRELLLPADFLLVEGFKAERTFPKIVCGGMDDPLALAHVDPDRQLDLGGLADLVEERAFLLPGLDCGGCGLAGCAQMAEQIVRGRRRWQECVSLQGRVQVSIDGRRIPLNPFVSQLLLNTLRGFLGCLKGFGPGTVTITWDERP